MMIDKIMMIVLRYGGLILMCILSFTISSYLYIIDIFGFKALIDYKLVSRPEIAIKYFWKFLKNYYYNRAQLPLMITVKIIVLLILPFICIKVVKVGLKFLIFYIGIKLKDKIPSVSKYILRNTNLVNIVHNNTQKKTQNNTANSVQGFNVKNQEQKKHMNLRK